MQIIKDTFFKSFKQSQTHAHMRLFSKACSATHKLIFPKKEIILWKQMKIKYWSTKSFVENVKTLGLSKNLSIIQTNLLTGNSKFFKNLYWNFLQILSNLPSKNCQKLEMNLTWTQIKHITNNCTSKINMNLNYFLLLALKS